ncbi:hypothetical protein GOQ30_09525 [Flavobacterium sp. TP390]|uniref:Uncharacterized protein n=1 Tax=Flavobacterium profundi TaxID=1774945 RepID=A0A6I4ISN7_9FLAO|nr:hypothetical protein [Flavobacterium profundi]MVO09397.1 hypothetical protein [Flavobacterium profundi]
MQVNRIIFLCLLLFGLTNSSYGQDTIKLKKKPKVTLKSWYPEYKDFPKLKIGKRKLLFVVIPEFNGTNFWKNHIALKAINAEVAIEETVKDNQYLVLVHATNQQEIEFELWYDLEKDTILIYKNGNWINARELYKLDGNRILIDTVKLQLEN